MTQIAVSLIAVAWIIAAALVSIQGGYNVASGWITAAVIASVVAFIVLIAIEDTK